MALVINPPSNDLTLGPADTLDEAITVTVPRGQKFRNVSLVASASIAPFVDSITPPGGYGPITGEQEQTLAFRVRFHGLPCKPEPQIFTGTLDVVADQRVVAKKDVRITVPACATSFVYSVKFVCGEQAACDCECTPVQPGRYATEINIHNIGRTPVEIEKRLVPVVLAGAPVGREPRTAGARATDRITLPPQTATMDDCCRMADLLFGAGAAYPIPITIGLLEITASGPLAVTAVYTASGLEAAGVSITVEQIAPVRA